MDRTRIFRQPRQRRSAKLARSFRAVFACSFTVFGAAATVSACCSLSCTAGALRGTSRCLLSGSANQVQRVIRAPRSESEFADGVYEDVSLVSLEKLLARHGISTSQAVLKSIMDEAHSSSRNGESSPALRMADLERWCRSLQRPTKKEARQTIFLQALRESGLWGSIAFAAGYVLNFGNIVGLWPASQACLTAACWMWLVGSFVFLNVQLCDARGSFEQREASLRLLQSFIRARDAMVAEPMLASLDANNDGIVTLQELQVFFLKYSILLPQQQLQEMISDATWRGSTTEVSVNIFISYLQQKPDRTLQDKHSYVASKLIRSFPFWCMNAYVLGAALFVADPAKFGTAGIIAFALGYVGHVTICLKAIKAQSAAISSAKAVLQNWACTAGARGFGWLASAKLADTDGNGRIDSSELRRILDVDFQPVPDFALQHVFREMHAKATCMASYADFTAYLARLRDMPREEELRYICTESMKSEPIWALILGLTSCLIQLALASLGTPVQRILKCCAFMSLLSGLVPIHVFFALKWKRYFEVEDVKLGLATLLLSKKELQA